MSAGVIGLRESNCLESSPRPETTKLDRLCRPETGTCLCALVAWRAHDWQYSVSMVITLLCIVDTCAIILQAVSQLMALCRSRSAGFLLIQNRL